MSAPLWLWILLGGLLALSGTCSASETALFSLTSSERRRAGRAAQRLLEHPRDLLISVLLANLVVNILYFAFTDRIEVEGDGYAGPATVLGSLVALLVVGEILPKTIGLRARLGIVRVVAPLWLVVVGLSRPIRRPLLALLDATARLLGSRRVDERQLSRAELARVLERTAEEGRLLESEADLLAEVVELKTVRVRELMTPRVDAAFLRVDGENRAEVTRVALERRLSWVPVVEESPDRVLGRVKVRDLLRRPDRPVAQLVMPVRFVPEVASALDLLRVLREERSAEAVVVDEWGGTAGFVTLEDVLEQVVGDLRVEGEERQPVAVPLGEGVYRVPGWLSVRDWNDRFGLRIVPTDFETVGGLVTHELGRIPRVGDVVSVGQLDLEVSEVRGRRVLAVDVQVARPETAEAAP